MPGKLGNACPTRRRVLRNLGVGTIGALLGPNWRGVASEVSADRSIEKVVKNRAPLTGSSFYFLPLGSIRPRGWLAAQLRVQADGLTGHLGKIWPDVGPSSGWLGGDGECWERGPYYVDGLLPLAYLINDARLKTIAHGFADWTLSHTWDNGMIGPRNNDDWWPRIVMLKALAQYQELTGDPRVFPVMDRYFRYQLSTLTERPLRDWARFRWQDEVLSIVWLYNRTGAPELLELARTLRRQGFDWIGDSRDFRYREKVTAAFLKLDQGQGLSDLALATHGVNNGQAIKCGTVWSQISGSAEDRSASFGMMQQLDRYHGLPNGMFSCDEHLAGPDPSQGSELCTVVECMYSLEHALAITGDPFFADRLERLAFNALPGALTDDMWAHQYNQEPNQVECSLHHRPWVSDGPESNLFGLAPNFGCCTANYHQGWPKFANSLWMFSGTHEQDGEDGLSAVAYAPCEVQALVNGTVVRVREETDYPFRGDAGFSVFPEKPVSFRLLFRIPGWAEGAAIRVNGRSMPSPKAGTFATVERTWTPGDRVEISFPTSLHTSRWFHDSIAVERGPLVFAFDIGEDWVKQRENGLGSADWQVYPTTPWNYALDVDPDAPDKSIKVIETPVGDMPFARSHAPVRLTAKGRQVTTWRAEDGAADPLPQSPVPTEEQQRDVSMIPYAAAKLRITAFPRVKS
jgi:uncharacterized protein